MSKLTPLKKKILDAFLKIGVGKPVTIEQIRAAMGIKPHEQRELTRRVRELEQQNGYQIPYDTKTKTYTLVSETPGPVYVVDERRIPGKLQAEIKFIANGRCGMCGKTIAEDGIRLVIDHRVPYQWGGPTEAENLWAICETCNIQKKDFIADLPVETMSQCMTHKETVKRLGELLKAFKGEIVPRSLLEIVGQDDEWTRRLRELRDLGWLVERVVDTSQRGRYQHAYRLVKSKPWPADIRSAIRLSAKKRKMAEGKDE
jgi:hypothetical protein